MHHVLGGTYDFGVYTEVPLVMEATILRAVLYGEYTRMSIYYWLKLAAAKRFGGLQMAVWRLQGDSWEHLDYFQPQSTHFYTSCRSRNNF